MAYYRVKVATFKLERDGNDLKSFPYSVGINLQYIVVLRKYHSLVLNTVKYKVTCRQTFGTHEECFKLWKGTDQAEGEEAYAAIQATIRPLLEKGVLLTTSLLEKLILPAPVHPSEIPARLTAHNAEHPEWGNIVKALQQQQAGSTANGAAVTCSGGMGQEPANGRIDKQHKDEDQNIFRKFESFILGIPSMMGYDSSEDKTRADEIWESLTQGRLDQDFPQDGEHCLLIDAIEKGHENTAIHLILCRFDTNKQCNKTGDTPLHLAVRKGNEKLVKLLLAYQADPSIANKVDKTPLDEAKDQKAIFGILDDVMKLREVAWDYYSSNNHPVVKNTSDDVFLLSLDGGGMKTVISCHILGAIQTRMKELDNDFTCMTKCFDYFAGTSAGAILGALLIYNSITSVWNSGMYLYKFMQEVFMCDKDERQERLKQFITDVIGEKTILSDLEDCNLIVTATIANVSPCKLHLMTNYNLEEGRRPVWEALLASSAAPTYFPPFQNKFIDGGLMANNPTLPAMAEVSFREEHRKIGFVLSVGTGHLKEKQKSDVSSVFVSGLNTSTLTSLYKSSKGLIGLLDHFMAQSTRTDGEVVFQARYWCRSLDAQYERLSPVLEEKVASDMSSIDELVDLLYETEMYILQEYYKIDKVARLLVQKLN